MSLKYQPENQNFLSPIAFKFICDAIPNVEYFCQQATLPGISINEVPVTTPLSTYYQPGDIVNFEDLNLTIIVDEDMKNWKEIYNWIIGLGAPVDQQQYAKQYERGISASGILSILNSSYNNNIEIHFYEMFPLSISGLQFDLTDNDITYLSANITFRYNRYEIK